MIKFIQYEKYVKRNRVIEYGRNIFSLRDSCIKTFYAFKETYKILKISFKYAPNKCLENTSITLNEISMSALALFLNARTARAKTN